MNSILLLGESGVGKTHFGAQLLSRLMKGDCRLRMNGQATNLEPFEAALESLYEGRSAAHTATSTYVDSIWPIVNSANEQGELVWPDYGGEQVRTIVASRRVPTAWQARVRESPAWLLLIRLQQARLGEDIFSRPLTDLCRAPSENHEVQASDQARLIELLQMLLYVHGAAGQLPLDSPRLGVLLTCWDELIFDDTPAAALQEFLPMLHAYVKSTWRDPFVMGLSALGKPLTQHQTDTEYVSRGPEHFGYVVKPDGSQSPDLTLSIHMLLEDLKRQGTQAASQ